MHPVDRAASLLFRYGPASLKVFQNGWGDDDLIESIGVAGPIEPPAPITITWADEVHTEAAVTLDGTFPSPADHLPAASRLAGVRKIVPHRPDGRLVVMVAAWNDHGYATRTGLATRLAARGVTTVMLENPYYGTRRAWDDPPIRTVADFAVMGRAAVAEGRALLAHFSTSHRVGISGYSMGGNIAALIGALMDRPVAIAALAASHSPGPVWTDGIIRHMVDWEALGGEDETERLRATLLRASVLEVPPPPHTASAVIVGGTKDGYIPRTAVEALHAHWPGSDLRWLPAGHATMIWRHKDSLVDAIIASLERTYGAYDPS
jgi:pimeloyl-ACP methyl ester carboxylesterase